MDAKELRIGNYILGNYMYYGDFEEAEKQEICEVLSLDSVGVCEYSIWVEGESATVEQYDSFNPIPLTEEWLLKFGFIQSMALTNYWCPLEEVNLLIDSKGINYAIPLDHKSY